MIAIEKLNTNEEKEASAPTSQFRKSLASSAPFCVTKPDASFSFSAISGGNASVCPFMPVVHSLICACSRF